MSYKLRRPKRIWIKTTTSENVMVPLQLVIMGGQASWYTNENPKKASEPQSFRRQGNLILLVSNSHVEDKYLPISPDGSTTIIQKVCHDNGDTRILNANTFSKQIIFTPQGVRSMTPEFNMSYSKLDFT